MKNLANCKPSEFLAQSNKIRKAVSEWLTLTDILNIRQQKPKFEIDMTDEERERLTAEQVQKNLNEMLDQILEEHAEETLNVLALMCFVDPKDVDKHPMDEYIEAFNELINNQTVINFFVSLARLGQTNTSGVRKA